jgi:hypothetical protein
MRDGQPLSYKKSPTTCPIDNDVALLFHVSNEQVAYCDRSSNTIEASCAVTGTSNYSVRRWTDISTGIIPVNIRHVKQSVVLTEPTS